MQATPDEREVIKRLAWYSTEFGLVTEDNRFKVFGAGIISGRAELANTVMEFYRLNRDNVIDFSGDVFAQLQSISRQHKQDIQRMIAAVNHLHQKGEMSSQDQGWNVVGALCDQLGISRRGYLGGEVILAPFEVEMIAQIPKTVYAFNPVFFVCESFEQMNALLDSYLKPIAGRAG
jgi:phenylalanine-4-hydroxylase